jgi:hypothetical protein
VTDQETLPSREDEEDKPLARHRFFRVVIEFLHMKSLREKINLADEPIG